MLMRVLVASLLAMSIAACSGPTLDMSTEESAKESMKKVRDSLPADKQAEFQGAVMLVTMSGVDIAALMGGKEGAEKAITSGKDALDGKNAEEVIALAQQIAASREAKKRDAALQEIAELEEKQAAAQKAMEELRKIEVSRARFYYRERQYLRPTPVIEITVKNGTEHAVSRLYFRGVIASAGRSVPWHNGEFNYSIPGGMEPGETQELALEPNMFGDWARVEAPDDAVFTVTVERADGADEKPLYDASVLSSREEKRLAELKKKFQP